MGFVGTISEAAPIQSPGDRGPSECPAAVFQRARCGGVGTPGKRRKTAMRFLDSSWMIFWWFSISLGAKMAFQKWNSKTHLHPAKWTCIRFYMGLVDWMVGTWCFASSVTQPSWEPWIVYQWLVHVPPYPIADWWFKTFKLMMFSALLWDDFQK